MRKGRCWHCNVIYEWKGLPLLRDSACPECKYKLCATTHYCKSPRRYVTPRITQRREV